MARSVPLALAALTLLAALGSFSVAAGDEDPQVPCIAPGLCPDLTTLSSTMRPQRDSKTFSARDCAVVEGMVEAGPRALLRFTFTTPNEGVADLVVGSPSLHPEWFVWSDCHRHYHFREYAAYRLWTPAAYAEWDSLRLANPGVPADDVLAANPQLSDGFVSGHKQGFCVIDVRLTGVGAPKYFLCEAQGISAGWADEYHSSLDGQWVDVTGLPRGSYVLEAEVNYLRLYEESSYDNNRAAVTVTI